MALLSGWHIELSIDPDVECLNLARVSVLHKTVWGDMGAGIQVNRGVGYRRRESKGQKLGFPGLGEQCSLSYPPTEMLFSIGRECVTWWAKKTH